MTVATERLELLSRFPEVKWDRTAGDGHVGCVFGWITRHDGLTDFLVLEWNGDVVWFVTSSARYSEEFWTRLGGNPEDHLPCRRVEVAT